MTIYTIEPKQAEPMNFPTITIPDPAAVGKWLDEELPQCNGWNHLVHYSFGRFSSMHWTAAAKYVDATSATPEGLLVNLRSAIECADPLAKLRKEAEQHGYALMKLPTD